jgi:hypothetical protein
MTKIEADLLVLHRDVRMKKLCLATVCVIALNVGVQAKPVQLTSVDRWVIEYDSELFAGACIATTGQNLLRLKISLITAYPREGQGAEKLWFVGFSSPEWTWIKSGTTYDFAIDTKRQSGETKRWPLVFTGEANGFMFAKANVDIVNSMASDYGEISFNIRNVKNNQYLAQREIFSRNRLFCVETYGVGFCICCYKFSRN